MSQQTTPEDRTNETIDIDPLKFATKHSSEKFEFPTSDKQENEDSPSQEETDGADRS